MRALGPHDVHVYLLRDDPAEQRELPRALAAWLAPDESARLARLVVPSVRRELLLGRGLLRATLSRHAAVAPPAWRFVAGEHGRPELAGPSGAPALRFNLSHARGMLAVAITLEHDVGVDVERTVRDVHDDALARRFFAPPEADDVTRREGNDRRDRFFRYWTLKEAYIKARGMGMVLPLDRFWVAPDASPVSIAFAPGFGDDASEWHLEQHQPGPEHALAVAVRRPAGVELSVRREWVPGPEALVSGW